MYQYPKQPDGNVDVHYTDVTFPATHTHTHRYGIAIIINILWKLANIYIAKFKDLAIKSKYTLAPLGRCTNTDTLRKFSLLVQPIIEKKNTIINLLF